MVIPSGRGLAAADKSYGVTLHEGHLTLNVLASAVGFGLGDATIGLIR